MVFKLSAYRVDWPAEAGVGRTRFYGVDDSTRMEMHVRHGENFKPKIVPLFQLVEAEEKTARGLNTTFSHVDELGFYSKPNLVPLLLKEEPVEKTERDDTLTGDCTITFSHMEELARFPVKDGIVDTQVFIDYTNYRGERAWRLIDCANSRTRFGTSKFHTEPQWLMAALDVSKGEEREFAVKDIHETRKAVITEMQIQLTPKDPMDIQGTPT